MKKEKLRKENNKGITLIALVITIIVLLILAGVTIATLTGENGILTQTSKAKDKTTEATAIEKVQVEVLGSYGTDGNIDESQLNTNLGNVEGLTSGLPIGDLPATVIVDGYNIRIDGNGNVKVVIKVADAKTNGTVFGDNTIIYDTYENSVKIPAGFKIASDSATDVTGGIVIEDAKYTDTIGSQFVWIPVGTGENAIKKADGIVEIALERYLFASDGTPSVFSGSNTEDTKTETGKSSYGNAIAKDIEDFKTKATNNHGYYIGRYEARKSTEGNLTVVAADSVYNNITQPNSAIASRNMYTDTPFTSDLMNSYAWDTAIVFEQIFDNRATDKKKPYSMQNSLNAGGVALATTGTNNLTDETKKDKICNIWDMASNCVEWTTETAKRSDCPCVYRGGYYNGSTWYTSHREMSPTGSTSSGRSFRPLLYL